MRAYREKDYDDMAGRVVDRFLRGETKLADAAVEEAMQGQLNPDQVERLVQAANTMAFLRMMESRKAEGAPDLTHEFDPVDTASVLQHIVGQTPFGAGDPPTPGQGMEPMSGNDALPDEMAAHRTPHAEPDGDEGGPPIDDDNDGPFPKGTKQKAHEADKPKKAPTKEPSQDAAKEAAIRSRRLRKLAETLEDQYLQAELAFEDAYEKLAYQFKRAHGGMAYEAFEKDAMSLDDVDHGTVVINLLREERGLAPLDEPNAREKHAALSDHHVASDSEALHQFEGLVKIAREAARVKHGAVYARALCS